MKLTPKEFFTTYYPAAFVNEQENGVPALFSLAQSVIETGWGKHAPGNNMFGIKADPSWKGPFTLLPTKEFLNGQWVTINDKFRAYPSPLDSFRDHAAFLKRWPRYADAFKTRDPREFARRVAKAGYATAPNYADAIIAVIDLFDDFKPPAHVPPATKTPSLLARIFGWFKGK